MISQNRPQVAQIKCLTLAAHYFPLTQVPSALSLPPSEWTASHAHCSMAPPVSKKESIRIGNNQTLLNELTFATFTCFLLLVLSSPSVDEDVDDDDEESELYPSSSSGVINDDNFPTRSLSLSGKSGSLIFPSQITTAVNVCPSLSATILQKNNNKQVG